MTDKIIIAICHVLLLAFYMKGIKLIFSKQSA